jgi:hypothetical protein
MDIVNGLAELFNIKGVLIAALIFNPRERIFAMHPSLDQGRVADTRNSP